MARVLCISPVRLYRHSFLGGTILLLATILLCVDFAIIGVRAYAFNSESGSPASVRYKQ